MKTAISNTGRFLAPITLLMWLAATALAATPGISGTTFNLTAQEAYLNQPDGEAVYSWGYGCLNTTGITLVPAAIAGATCPTMQVPGPTLVVTEGQTIKVILTNGLPTAAGNTSILFPGFQVTATGGVTGLLTQEAAPGGTVTYTFTATAPGTHPYYSGTQGDLQIEMGLYGAVIVLPATVPANCTTGYHALNLQAESAHGEADFRLANATAQVGAAYDHPASCYDREYLFQWAEMDSRIHRQAQAQVAARAGCTAGTPGCSLDVQTEPYHPAYFLINGRSMPDLMDPNFAGEYPHQPYNGNPHMHPGELTLIRTIGQGRMQHPFHEHANHVRILARDGNLVLSSSATPITYRSGLSGDAGVAGPGLAGTLMFNTDTTPGEAFDGIFYFTGRGLNWDPFGHHPGADTGTALASPAAITGASESGTVTITSALNPPVGSTVTITGVTPAGYNGSFTVVSSGPLSFTYTDTFRGLAPGTGGLAQDPSASITTPVTITGATEVSGTTVTITTALNSAVGDTVIIAGVTPAGYNGTFTVATRTATSFTYVGPAGLTPGTAFGTAQDTSASTPTNDPLAHLSCTADANGYNTGDPTAVNFFEWCQDHNKPLQVAPFGDVAGGGPATLPDPNVFTNGQWYGGTPYLGPDASLRAAMSACAQSTGSSNPANANCTTLLPSNTQANPANERGWAFMWHSHNEREITTNNVFPGGMLMMMLVDSREFAIDESQ